MQLCHFWHLSKKIHRLGSAERVARCFQQFLRAARLRLSSPAQISDVPAFPVQEGTCLSQSRASLAESWLGGLTLSRHEIVQAPRDEET